MGNSTRRPHNHDNRLKLAVFGLTNSGKFTFTKQIRILYRNQFTDEEKTNYKKILHSNVLVAFRELINMVKSKGTKIDNEEICKFLTEKDPYHTNLTSELALHIKSLWNNSVKELYNRRYEFNTINYIPHNIDYCMEIIDHLADPEYTVSNEDILHARIRSTGIGNVEFNTGRYTFCLMDEPMGGNRRAEIGHLGVIFFAALDEWDVMSSEYPDKTKMDESLELLESLVKDQYFGNLPLILILNKKDTFKDKITWNDLSRVYPEYTGGSDYNQAIEFIKNLYLARADPTRQIPAGKDMFSDKITEPVPIDTYITCALDTEEIKQLMESMTKFILNTLVSPA